MLVETKQQMMNIFLRGGLLSKLELVVLTTGIFLMRLVNNPNSLKEYTHLIMDEVHERDLDIDFSLVVVKRLIGRGDEDGLKFKLILKSATSLQLIISSYKMLNTCLSFSTIVSKTTIWVELLIMSRLFHLPPLFHLTHSL